MTIGNMKLTENYDVAIVGGGLAGLSLARQLLLMRNNIKIIVLEYRKHPVPEAAHKVGESLVEIGAHYFNTRLQLSEHLKNDQLKKAGLRFFYSNQDNQDISKRIEFGATFFPKAPSFQLDRGRFENYLGELIKTQGAEFIDAAKVLNIEIGKEAHTITYSRNEEKYTLQARWIVDASGRSGKLKRQLGLVEEVPHDINTAWFRVNGKIDLDTWSNSSYWLEAVPRDFRYLSTNHLMGKGYWTWLIPLASNCTSVGIVADASIHPFEEINRQEKALDWIARHEPQLSRTLVESGLDIIDFHTLKHYSHGCKQVYSAERWAITGEAGVFLDPFYSPGSDFIALSNDFVTDLIISELDSDNIHIKAAYYNQQYLDLFKTFLTVYQNQYPTMGHAGAMTHKVIWDYAVYWGTVALLFFNKKYTDMYFMQSIAKDMQSLVQLNQKVQALFCMSIEDPEAFPIEHFTDTMSYAFLQEWNSNLLNPYQDDELCAKIKWNINYLHKIAEQFSQKKSLKQALLEMDYT